MYLWTSARQAARLSAAPQTRSISTLCPGSSVTTRRVASTGSSTAPLLPESGCAWRSAAGACRLRPRPMKRARSLSCEAVPAAAPCTETRWNMEGEASSAERGRRVHSSAGGSATISVCRNSLLKAGCWASAAAGASTGSV